MLKLAQASLVTSQKDFPFSGLDEFFRNLDGKLKDGYAAATDGKSFRYLSIIEGKPYSSAAIEGDRRWCADIKDFFIWCREKGQVDIDVFEADKKLLLCMLVKMNYRPSQSFTTDVVNLEDVIKRIKKQGKDAVMAIGSDGELGFAIFLKGDAAYAALPQKEEGAESPLDRLLLYTYSVSADKPLSVEIYTETKVSPAKDSAPFPAGGIATHYVGAPSSIYVELVEEGVVKGTYPVKEKLTIGREKTNQMCLSEAGVSREHAVIKPVKGRYIIEDIKSANGTFFKGIRITAKELNDGDEINIRKYTLRFHGPKKEADIKRPPEPAPELKPVPPPEAPGKTGKEPVTAGATLTMEDGTVYPLANITTIGKDEDCDINLSGMLVAKKHATVIKGMDFHKVIRKSGLAPLRVNGEKVDEQTLKDGDVIEIGGHTLKFRAAGTFL